MANKNSNDFNQFLPKLIIAVFLFGLGLWVGRNVTLPFLPENQSKINVLNKVDNKNTVDFATFWQVWDKLNKDFLNKKDLSGQKLLQGAISGLVQAAGDPYTAYFSPDANKSFNDQLSGSFQGVGIELGSKDSQLVVIAPLDDSPAQKAGILSGDKIVGIDGKDATKLTIADAVTQIRGKAGTKVKLTISRDSFTEPKDFELTRSTITVNSVKETVSGDTAIVSVSQFGDNTRDEWDKAVNDLTTKGINKMVLDLRNDPGGRLDVAIYIASDFLKTGDVVVQEEDPNGNRQPFTTDHEGRLQTTKVVILVNKGSASASEIVTGALKDHGRAQVAGETSFGKGTVQNVVDLKDGSSLHLTIAKWLTPNGTWVHGKGIDPDVKVGLTAEDVAAGRDPQLDKAKELLK